jgi:serine/threonine-protein kinase HipA
VTRALEAWLEGVHVGRFTRAPDGAVRFAYDDGAPATPISLSLPRDGQATRQAAAHFLENLLPDEHHTRARMAQAYEASGTGTSGRREQSAIH